MTNTKLGTFLAAACVMMMTSLAAARQCEERWFSFGGVAGLNDVPYAAAMWDPDGSGPRHPLLVVGGQFDLAGDVPDSRYLAAWDPSAGEWTRLGPPLSGVVEAILPASSGDLIVAGRIGTAGDVKVYNVARFDGVAWHAMGMELKGDTTYALAELPDGRIVAGGEFGMNTSNPIKYIAEWNGVEWSAIPGNMNERVWALRTMSNGDLIAGGQFTNVGGSNAKYIARWNGQTWSKLGVGTNHFVHALCETRNGDLIAGGEFFKAGGKDANYIARWDGADWWPLGPGRSYMVRNIVELNSGDIVASDGSPGKIGAWDGAAWRSLGGGVDSGVDALGVLPDGRLWVGGSFKRAGDTPVMNAAIWDGNNWSATTAQGSDRPSLAVASHPNGDVYVGGDLTTIAGVSVNRIARWDGRAWHALGDGIGGTVRVITVAPDGDVYVGGDFTQAGGESAANIARWDGNAWHALGDGVSAPVYAIDCSPNGDVVVGGGFAAGFVKRWDGSQWNPMGTMTQNGDLYPVVYAVRVLRNGDVIAGGLFDKANGISAKRIARWHDGQWSPLGPGLGNADSRVFSIVEHPNGDIIACGSIAQSATNPQSLARWDGTQWLSVGSRSVYAANTLELTPDGLLLMGGSVTGVGDSLLRFDGDEWAVVAGKLDEGAVADITVRPNGQIVVVGNFLYASGIPAAYVARVACACPSDLDGDGLIDSGDFNQFEAWFEIADVRADFNGDGFVNGDDYDEFASAFDAGC
ncbi:MAG: hypothetical protein HUU19_16060 [Phycisphaerales bacterium]|nr:hypothetical protein [Phycisphaerales bacterium]